jgi:hypothetical protein
MKTPRKVIEKISLPIMFVTFVMAVLMFAVSPVSAAPPSQCGDPTTEPGDFCDQDEINIAIANAYQIHQQSLTENLRLAGKWLPKVFMRKN